MAVLSKNWSMYETARSGRRLRTLQVSSFVATLKGPPIDIPHIDLAKDTAVFTWRKTRLQHDALAKGRQCLVGLLNFDACGWL